MDTACLPISQLKALQAEREKEEVGCELPQLGEAAKPETNIGMLNHTMPETPENLIEAVRYFSGLKVCFEGLKEFEQVLRGIAKVPKTELDKAVAKDAEKRAAKRKKKA